jgi:hypothetical protein
MERFDLGSDGVPSHVEELAKDLGIPEPDWYVGSADSGRTSRRGALEDAADQDLDDVEPEDGASGPDDPGAPDF